ncbi:MAG: 4-hydroxyphenylacetate 3-hydroxylase N-terminal domain-containing protein [Steroidobacteraceae bacterium]|jgi:4-hydroxyphenylacetate 3-monooxygenase/4-hydroxybutyryl-CoA dehydratase/vinylacetyl-CoA-Delta-isomerase|nr:4-hydroxyphenylacetate 3-hydroxylase N-terminal domain-containing protein [Steroidobacteraceae bacterium]
MLITSEEWVERQRGMRKNIHMNGDIVGRDHPLIEPGRNVIAMTYDMAQDEKYKGVATAKSSLDGSEVNRWCNLHTSVEDLLIKQKSTRVGIHNCGFCMQRCMGNDGLNALAVVTKELDEEYGGEYHERFLSYARYFQKNDITSALAMTDVKGDRSKRPAEQADPDLYLRIVERRKDGIVVRGAKAHITMAPYADEIIVLPTRVMSKDERDYAVAFALPADHEGVLIINRASAPRRRKQLKSPMSEYGSSDAVVVFDDVFVPWDRVFMCGEYRNAGRLALLFANYHRHAYTGCKPGVTDVIMGFTELVAEQSGIERAQHVRHELAELIGVAELTFAAGIASAVHAEKSSSGVMVPNAIYSNVGRRLAGENIYHEHNILVAIAGGLPATLPFEEDFIAERTAPFLEKYMARKRGVPTEEIHRCFRAIADLTCSGFGGVWQIAGVHGGGSPIMETIAILANYNLKEKTQIAKYLSGIEVVEKSDDEVFEGERANLEKFKRSLEIFRKDSEAL